MNKGPVIVKGSKEGITIIIDENADFDQVKLDINTRFSKCNHDNKIINPIKVVFEGKAISKDEQMELISILENAGLKINQSKDKTISYVNYIPNDKDGLFYIGNIRNGQILEAKESIVIIGNVFSGGVVISSGSIVVIGSVWGKVFPGKDGRKDTFSYNFS